MNATPKNKFFTDKTGYVVEVVEGSVDFVRFCRKGGGVNVVMVRARFESLYLAAHLLPKTFAAAAPSMGP